MARQRVDTEPICGLPASKENPRPRLHFEWVSLPCTRLTREQRWWWHKGKRERVFWCQKFETKKSISVQSASLENECDGQHGKNTPSMQSRPSPCHGRKWVAAVNLPDSCRGGRIRMVWIGYPQNDPEKSILPVAHAGRENGYLATVSATWADNERGQGPSGTALRTGKPAWAKNIREEQKFAPWREQALAHGYASSLSLPLTSAATTFGVLSLYSAETGQFNENTFERYVELAENLAFGISTIRAREEPKKSDEALRRSEAYLAEGQRLSHTGSWAWNVARQENVY